MDDASNGNTPVTLVRQSTPMRFCIDLFRRLPSALFLLTLSTLSGQLVQSQQQCRLQLNRNADLELEPPVNGGNHVPSNGSWPTPIHPDDGGYETSEPVPTPTTTTTTEESDSTSTSRTSTPIPSPSETPAGVPMPPFDYATDKIRAVNLGGWLVLEPWITPSVFERTGDPDIVDEYTLGQRMDRTAALELLREHWETWITEDDFIAIREAGLNHVRIPLGYWSVPLTSDDSTYPTSPDPYIPGAWTYLLRGLNWARRQGIRVIVDLHGAPGSQNGFDNSGQRTSNPRWAVDPDNIPRTVDVVRYIAENVGGMIDVLELLNEPAGFRGEQWSSGVRRYWENGYDAVREVAGEEMKIMIGDAFIGVHNWERFLVPPRGHDVLMDVHQYQIFSDGELDRSAEEHLEFTCSYNDELPPYAGANLWTVIGEWSNALTDCARWLNGRNIGARWDNTYTTTGGRYHGSCAEYTGNYENWTEEYRRTLGRYFQAQMEIGERVQGWVFWTWKAEDADEWSYSRGVEGGWIPAPPTARLYPDLCPN